MSLILQVRTNFSLYCLCSEINNFVIFAAIAVASGPFIYVYKNLRPYFKFTLPTLDVNPTEQDLWDQARDVCNVVTLIHCFIMLSFQDRIDVMTLRETLDGLRCEGTTLTVRSLRFLQLQPHDLETFASYHKHAPLKRQVRSTYSCIWP
jgi:Bardet-Biedl syndrome 1 protein